MLKNLLKNISRFFKKDSGYLISNFDGMLFDGYISETYCGWTREPKKAMIFCCKSSAKRYAKFIQEHFEDDEYLVVDRKEFNF